jgi:uncharacterized membrane protein
MATDNPKSTASIFGHPIHVMLVSFPIAFFVAALACDLVFWRSGDPDWASAATWLLGAGLVMAALAAVAGLIDFLGEARVRALSDAWQHMIGNVILVGIQLFNFYQHYAFGADGVVPTGLLLSLVAVALLLFNGWKGWTLVQTHHVGVGDDSERLAAQRQQGMRTATDSISRDDGVMRPR